MKRVLVFFPHNPFPPRSGAHHRCIEILAGLRALDAQVTLASAHYTTETKWDTISERARAAAGSPDIVLHTPTRADWRYHRYWQLFHRYVPRRAPLSSVRYVLPSMKTWFAGLHDKIRPDLVMINYAFFDRIVSPHIHASTPTSIEMLDFVTLYKPRFDLMKQYLPSPPLAPERVPPSLLQENFFDVLPERVAPEEYRIYDKYTHTIAITTHDGALVQQHAPHTRVAVIPMTYDVPPLENSYDGNALYTTGPNPFNTQGYLYFVGRVLPHVLTRAPDFRLDVTGYVSSVVEPTNGIVLHSFVEDLNALFARARFFVCPILGKTGQLVKITEAMAHGLAVIALARAAEGSPLRHGENGFIAHNAAEFAEFVAQLWRDPALCRRMGSAARQTIAEYFSRDQLRAQLKQLF